VRYSRQLRVNHIQTLLKELFKSLVSSAGCLAPGNLWSSAQSWAPHELPLIAHQFLFPSDWPTIFDVEPSLQDTCVRPSTIQPIQCRICPSPTLALRQFLPDHLSLRLSLRTGAIIGGLLVAGNAVNSLFLARQRRIEIGMPSQDCGRAATSARLQAPRPATEGGLVRRFA
jgi:hypothetical protein